jgi:hypothetical protein
MQYVYNNSKILQTNKQINKNYRKRYYIHANIKFHFHFIHQKIFLVKDLKSVNR